VSGMEIGSILGTIGGAGKVIMTIVRHMPAPTTKPSWHAALYRWAFDTLQDLFNNNDRVGERAESTEGAPESGS
jgi:hypothetical protein